MPDTKKRAAAAQKLIEEEEAKRHHILVVVAGHHAQGFPTPKSSVELQAIHIEKTEKLLAVTPPANETTRTETVDGVSIEYSSTELGHVLRGVVEGDGARIERALGAQILTSSREHWDMRKAITFGLSRNVYEHYVSKVRDGIDALPANHSALHVLLMLRQALTCANLLDTGDVVLDLPTLIEKYEFPRARELIDAVAGNHHAPLPEGGCEQWQVELQRAIGCMDEARDHAYLGENPSELARLDNLLVALRRVHFAPRPAPRRKLRR